MDELRRQDWVPRSTRQAGRQIERARERWTAVRGGPPTDRELAGELGIETGELRDRRDELERGSIVSLNAPARVGGEDGEIEIGERVPAAPGDFGGQCRLLGVASRSRRTTARWAAERSLRHAGESRRERRGAVLADRPHLATRRGRDPLERAARRSAVHGSPRLAVPAGDHGTLAVVAH